jgi:hypothetical protein
MGSLFAQSDGASELVPQSHYRQVWAVRSAVVEQFL